MEDPENGLAGVADRAVAGWAARAVTPRHVPALRALTQLGGTEIVVSAGLVAGLVARARRRTWRPAVELGLVIAGQNVIYNAVKRITNRARPDGPHHSFFSGTSFPSGHTATAAASWPAIARAAGGGPGMRAAGLAAGPVVGATRILLGVHWLSDVVAGLLLGWGWLAVITRIGRARRRWHRLTRRG